MQDRYEFGIYDKVVGTIELKDGEFSVSGPGSEFLESRVKEETERNSDPSEALKRIVSTFSGASWARKT